MDRIEKLVLEFDDFANDVEKERMKAHDSGESPSLSEPIFRSSGTVPVNPPRLTLNYDSPATCEGELKVAILEQSSHKLLAVVASGRGGVGKSCAIRGLNSDDDMRMKFPDGVQFLRLGKDAGMDVLIQEIARVVEGTGNEKLAMSIRGVTQLSKAVYKARRWFADRRCLFLVDDAWKANGFDAGSFYDLADMINSESRLVYTTRDVELALAADRCIRFGPRKPEESRTMFMTHAGLEMNRIGKRTNMEALEVILDVCGGIPLRLAVTGAGVRQYFPRMKGPREDALGLYHEELKQAPHMLVTQDCEGYGPMRNVLDASISVLEGRWNPTQGQGKCAISIRVMHRMLCVLEKQQEVPVSMLQRLWGLSEKWRAVEVMEALHDVSVVEVTIPENGSRLNSMLRVHDDILDVLVFDAREEKRGYVRRLLNNYLSDDVCVDTEPISVSVNAEVGEKRKLRSFFNLRRLHRLKLNEKEEKMVKPQLGKREWWKVGDEDGYLDENVCRLLKEAGEFEELIWLLFRPQWIIKRLQKSGIFAVEKDIAIGIEAIGSADIGTKEEKKRSLKVIAQAARLSHHAVTGNPREAWFQLYGRLILYSETCETTKMFLEELEQSSERPWAKAEKGFLSAAGEAMMESIDVSGLVKCIVKTKSELKVLCCRDGKVLVVTYNLKYGSRRAVDLVGATMVVTMSNDGKFVIGVDSGGFLRKWEAESGQGIGEAAGICVKYHNFIGLSEDSRWIACGLLDKVLVCDTQSGISVKQFKYEKLPVCHEDTRRQTPVQRVVPKPLKRDTIVTCVAVSWIGRKVVCGLSNGEIWILGSWCGSNVTASEVRYSHNGNSPRGSGVSSVAISKNGELIASGSTDGRIVLWNSRNSICVSSVDGLGSVVALAFAGETKRILWGSLFGKFGVWEYENGNAVTALSNEDDEITYVGASEDGAIGLCGAGDGTVRMWDMRNGETEIVPIEEEGYSRMRCFEISADERWIATGHVDGMVQLWGVETRTPVPHTLRGHTNSVTCFAFCHGSLRLVSGSTDETVRVWDVRSAQAVSNSLRGHMDHVLCMAGCADAPRVVSGSENGVVCVWDAQRAAAVGAMLHRDRDIVVCVAISSDGLRVASASEYSLIVWDVESKVEMHHFSLSEPFDPFDLHLNQPVFMSIIEEYHEEVDFNEDRVFVEGEDFVQGEDSDEGACVPACVGACVWFSNGRNAVCHQDLGCEVSDERESPPRGSRKLELSTSHGDLWLGTTDKRICHECKFGFFYKTGFLVRFCEVQGDAASRMKLQRGASNTPQQEWENYRRLHLCNSV